MSKARQLDGNVYVLHDQAVSAFVLDKADVNEYTDQEMSIEELGAIAKTMSEYFLNNDWDYFLREAIVANGYKIKQEA